MPYVEMQNRNQIKMVTLDTRVDSEIIAKVIDKFVDSQDLKRSINLWGFDKVMERMTA